MNGVPTGGAGDIHRIVYTPSNQAPVAALTASAPYGARRRSRSTSTPAGRRTPDGDTLTYEWALDGDGVFNDGGGATKTKTYPAPGLVTVHGAGQRRRGRTRHRAGAWSPRATPPPTITAMSARPASLTWSVGQTISFSATATDAQQSLPDSAYSWSLVDPALPERLPHAPRADLGGATDRQLPAPDHEYPSDLLLQVTVTDNQGLTDVETRQLDPKSVAMTFASNPTGAALTVAGAGVFAPHNQTFIQGSELQRVRSGDPGRSAAPTTTSRPGPTAVPPRTRSSRRPRPRR